MHVLVNKRSTRCNNSRVSLRASLLSRSKTTHVAIVQGRFERVHDLLLMRDVVDSLWAARKRQEEKEEAGVSAQLDTGKEAREDLARKDSAHYFSTQGWAALDPMPRLAAACFLLNIESLEALRGDFWVFLKSGFRQALFVWLRVSSLPLSTRHEILHDCAHKKFEPIFSAMTPALSSRTT